MQLFKCENQVLDLLLAVNNHECVSYKSIVWLGHNGIDRKWGKMR